MKIFKNSEKSSLGKLLRRFETCILVSVCREATEYQGKRIQSTGSFNTCNKMRINETTKITFYSQETMINKFLFAAFTVLPHFNFCGVGGSENMKTIFNYCACFILDWLKSLVASKRSQNKCVSLISQKTAIIKRDFLFCLFCKTFFLCNQYNNHNNFSIERIAKVLFFRFENRIDQIPPTGIVSGILQLM